MRGTRHTYPAMMKLDTVMPYLNVPFSGLLTDGGTRHTYPTMMKLDTAILYLKKIIP